MLTYKKQFSLLIVSCFVIFFFCGCALDNETHGDNTLIFGLRNIGTMESILFSEPTGNGSLNPLVNAVYIIPVDMIETFQCFTDQTEFILTIDAIDGTLVSNSTYSYSNLCSEDYSNQKYADSLGAFYEEVLVGPGQLVILEGDFDGQSDIIPIVIGFPPHD